VKVNALLLALAALFVADVSARAQDNSAALNLIRRECSTCHGPQGISVSPTFPNLAAQTKQYLDAQLKAFRDRSRADPHAQAFMWGMAAQLTDDTIKQMAEFFAQQPPPRGEPPVVSEEMALVKLSRLSVQPVTAAEWAKVCAMGGVKP